MVPKQDFEFQLSKKAEKRLNKADEYMVAWKKSTSRRAFGSWLRENKPREFNRRYNSEYGL